MKKGKAKKEMVGLGHIASAFKVLRRTIRTKTRQKNAHQLMTKL